MVEETEIGLVENLSEKIEQILLLYKKMKAENRNLLLKNEELKNEIHHKNKQLEEIENKYNNLKVAKRLIATEQTEGSDVKVRINKLVREIDKCIALLNQ